MVLFPSVEDFRHATHTVGEKAHLFYFGAVFFEGHGWYATTAGVCLGFGLLWEATGLAELLGGVAAAAVAAGEVT